MIDLHTKGGEGAQVPTNRLRDIEAGAWESILVVNYSAMYSHVLSLPMTELTTIFHAAVADLRAFAFAERGNGQD